MPMRKILKNRKCTLRELLRINTFVVFLIFALVIGLFFENTYRSQKIVQKEELNIFLDQEIVLLETKIFNYDVMLQALKKVVEGELDSGRNFNPQIFKGLMTSLIADDSNLFNIYFALEPAQARQFIKTESFVYLVRKNQKNIDKKSFNDRYSIKAEVITDTNYSSDPKEIWYHEAKGNDHVHFTKEYYDETYNKMNMISAVLSLKNKKGEFIGTVGLDLPYSMFLTDSFNRQIHSEYHVILVDGSDYTLDSKLKKVGSSTQFDKELPLDFLNNIKIPNEKEFNLADSTGKNWTAVSRKLDNTRWRVVVLKGRSAASSMIAKMSLELGGLCILLLFLQVQLSGAIFNKIYKTTLQLVESFKENSANIVLQGTEFQPVLAKPLDVSEMDDMRILWNHFLQEFTFSLKEAQREQEKSYRAVAFQSAFLANMSHEIRTPMNAIVGIADILAETPLSEQQHSYLNIFKNSSENLLDLLNDILDISKIEAGSLSIENVDMDLRRLAEDANMTFKHKAQSKNISFSFDIEPDVHVHVKGDPMRLRQVIFNLISNAIKFTEKGAVVVNIKTGSAPFETIVQIKDTGIGIPKNKIDSIFEKFTQADASTTRKFGGTGLGLSIVRSIVGLMDGQVIVQSEEGIGSCFTVTVKLPPCAAPPAIPLKTLIPVPATTMATPIFSKKWRILVADDVKENRMVIQMYLKSLGLDCELTTNGKEAVEKFKAEDFDLIFMDIQMPIMDGVSALHQIRYIQDTQKGIRIPIIALTAFASNADQEKYLKEGFDNYMTKPMTKAAFQSKLLHYLAA